MTDSRHISNDAASPFLSEEEAAAQLDRTPGTLRNWRSQGRGPRWATNPDTGRFFGYTQDAIDEWVARATSTEASA